MYSVSHLNELNCLLTRQGYFVSTFEIQITFSQLATQPFLFGHVFFVSLSLVKRGFKHCSWDHLSTFPTYSAFVSFVLKTTSYGGKPGCHI